MALCVQDSSLGGAGHSTATDGRRSNREPASTRSRCSIRTSTPPLLERDQRQAGRRPGQALTSQRPRPRSGALTALKGWSEGRGLVEVAAPLGGTLPALGAVAVAALADPLQLGRGPLQRGANLIGLDLGDRALVTLGGLPASLAQPAGDHDPVALGQGVGQVLGLVAPDVDLEEAGVAVAPLAVLLDALSHGDAQVGDGDAGVGEAEVGVSTRWSVTVVKVCSRGLLDRPE
jgi:hypothetical protein